MLDQRLLLLGNPEVFHVGGHLCRAARELGLEVRLCDTRRAFDGPPWQVRLNWRLRGRRPLRLRQFSRQVVEVCEQFRPRWLLATGTAPLGAWALDRLARLGVERLNYLTDDPWNPAHRAPWFMEALPRYDHVYSPRRANLDDVSRVGCPRVTFLPFAYAPDVHYPQQPTSDERERFACEVVFVGGADRDRVPVMAKLVDAGFDLHLYGGYWQRGRATRAHARGHADPETVRKATSTAGVALCLVRRANRDGHVMRSFEIPAIGACMLAEDTTEHREIFGPEGGAALYFHTVDDMLTRLRWLLDHPAERQRLAAAAHRLIVTGPNTYQDRLIAMLGLNVDTLQCAHARTP